MEKINDDILLEINRQADEWLQSPEQRCEVRISLQKTGVPDCFAAGIDRKALGRLMVAITSSPELANVAYNAVLYLLSCQGDEERIDYIKRIEQLIYL